MKHIKLFEQFVNEAYTLQQAIKDYTAEVAHGKELKEEGVKHVSAIVAGQEMIEDLGLIDGDDVPIDNYISWWETKLAELKSGKVKEEDAEKYNY
jgi:hypothetical protein